MYIALILVIYLIVLQFQTLAARLKCQPELNTVTYLTTPQKVVG